MHYGKTVFSSFFFVNVDADAVKNILLAFTIGVNAVNIFRWCADHCILFMYFKFHFAINLNFVEQFYEPFSVL